MLRMWMEQRQTAGGNDLWKVKFQSGSKDFGNDFVKNVAACHPFWFFSSCSVSPATWFALLLRSVKRGSPHGNQQNKSPTDHH